MKDIKGYKGLYGITEEGQVWSYPKSWITGSNSMKMTTKGKFIKQRINNKGYLMISLSKNNRSKLKTVHRLIAQTYIPNSLNLPQVNHKNGIKTDNRAENLEWCTNAENHSHGIKLGLLNQYGENNPSNKLTAKQVHKIRELYATGKYSQQQIANTIKISRENVGLIVRRQRWTHIL